jgi:hypothetical protein
MINADRDEELDDLAKDLVLDAIGDLVCGSMTLDEALAYRDDAPRGHKMTFEEVQTRDEEIEALRLKIEDLQDRVRDYL